MIDRRALFLRAIRGPIILMTIGTLFVWQQSNVMSVGRTWPLVLIVLGILRLLERIASPAVSVPPVPPPPPGGFSR